MYMAMSPQDRIIYHLRTLQIVNQLIYSAICAETLSVTDTMLRGLVQLQVNSELVRIWKYEVILTSFTGILMKGKPRKRLFTIVITPTDFGTEHLPSKNPKSQILSRICRPSHAGLHSGFPQVVSLSRAIGLHHFWLFSIVCIMSVTHATFPALFIKDVTSTGE